MSTDSAPAAAGIALPTPEQVAQALSTVNDPEIHRPITELGMVKSIEVTPGGVILVGVWLTVSGCPLRDTITREVTAAVSKLPGVTAVRVELDVMSEEQRRELQTKLRGGQPEKEIPFAKPGSLTKVYAIASGKGGVGKSSVTVNLAVALAAQGIKVGLLDADIYGHSVPRMLGVTERPTQVEQMIMPPTAHGVRAISSGMLKKGNEPLPLRGPILHRLLQQFLADVFWGDLDILLLDLPPGTGDVAISAAHLIPGSELLVVTTPQLAAAEVAERAGSLAIQLHQRVVGVIENMSYLPCPHCGERVDVFGHGGGAAVADTLTRLTGAPVPLLGEVPIDPKLREAGDSGLPLVLAEPDAPASQQLRKIAENLAGRSRSLAGRQLGLSPA
ncbi:MAG TPA: Mrp/NBP35 family ATP-binding protein [Streptosporangiaceae bacterium]|jgi:ATP-binding protein involved in chromosome partitioning|nr:Mrp/NBP35 family ATP-binding protein [Streptosporangiaceae bacterium]